MSDRLKQLASDIAAQVLERVLASSTPGWRPQGFIEVTPINDRGNPVGGKLSINCAHVVRLAPYWSQSRTTTNNRPIGTAIRMSDGKAVQVREYYHRVLWLVYKARNHSVASYEHKRDDAEFRTWAAERLNWQPPAWLTALDDRNYVAPQDLEVEPQAQADGTVMLSDGTRAIPSDDGKTLYHMPKQKIDDDGNPVQSIEGFLHTVDAVRREHFHGQGKPKVEFGPDQQYLPPSDAPRDS